MKTKPYNLERNFRSPWSFLKEKSKAMLYILSEIEKTLQEASPKLAESLEEDFKKLRKLFQLYPKGRGGSIPKVWTSVAARESKALVELSLNSLSYRTWSPKWRLSYVLRALDNLPLGIACCPFCLSSTNCLRCPYAARHRPCGDPASTYREITKKLQDVEGKIRSYLEEEKQ